MTVPAAGGPLLTLGSSGWLHIRHLVWLAGSLGVILTAMQSHSSPGQIWKLSYPGGKPRRITNDLNDYLDLSLTADSQDLLAVQGDALSNIWTVPEGKAARARQVTFGAGTQDGIYGLDRTPDGRLIYASMSTGARELWVLDNGTHPQQITTDADIAFFSTPSMCPDGRTVLYGAGPLRNANVWRVNITGGKPKALTPGGTNGGPSCSPDGKWAYFNALGQYYMLWRVPIEGGAAEQLTRFPSTFPHVSPDGKWLAYIIEEPKRTGFGIVSASGGSPFKTLDAARSSPGGAAVFRWSPSGDAIDYVDTRNGVSNIWRQSLDGGPPREVTDFNAGLIFNFVWLPGGRDLAVARGSTTSDVVRIRDF
jgi:Tol biopolymer transport system component